MAYMFTGTCFKSWEVINRTDHKEFLFNHTFIYYVLSCFYTFATSLYIDILTYRTRKQVALECTSEGVTGAWNVEVENGTWKLVQNDTNFEEPDDV